MKILILNQDWFVEEFRELGHEVVTCGMGEHLDVALDVPLTHLDTIVKDFLSGEYPDRILVLDNSAPIVVDGLAETDIPVAFYSVDTHHHSELHRDLCHVFDHIFVAQKDYLDEFQKESPVSVEWLPLFASRYIEIEQEKEYGAVFVGNLNKKLNPDRVRFFDQLQAEIEMLCTTGKFWEIFPRSHIVINQTVKGDLNFRVFEAMMSGAMLLTEKSSNGLLELFEDGKHLVTYEKDNVSDAAEKVRYFLSNQKEAQAIGEDGRREVLEKHTPRARAEQILRVLSRLEKQATPHRFFSWMSNFTDLSRKLRKLDTSVSSRAIINALKSASLAIEHQEPLPEKLSFSLVYAACRYDMEFSSFAGHDLLIQAHDRYKEYPLISLGLLRNFLNKGSVDRARDIAKIFEPLEANEVFARSEVVISELLREAESPQIAENP